MVAFVQRVWQSMKQAGEIKRNDENPLHTTNPSRGGFPDRGRGNNRGRSNGRRRGGYKTGLSGFRGGFRRKYVRGRRSFQGNGRRRGGHSDDTSLRSGNKYPDGRNNKREFCYYKYGSTVHFAADCNGSGTTRPVKPEKRFEKSPKVHPTKISKK